MIHGQGGDAGLFRIASRTLHAVVLDEVLAGEGPAALSSACVELARSNGQWTAGQWTAGGW